jgi:hypothetical protein
MFAVDLLWGIGWFFAGLFTFQIRGVKSAFTAISTLFSSLSLFSLLLQESNPIAIVITSIGLDHISGIFTSVAYLLGANISRYEQFGEMSPRIVLYILILVVWIALEISF